MFEISIKFISGSRKYIEFNLPVAPSLWTGPISTSILFFLKVFNHERNDDDISNKNNKNFWYENNSTGKLLFANIKKNEKFLNDYKIIENNLSEFFIFLNCSGNGVNTPYIPMNYFFLKIINLIDHLLVKFMPGTFALNRRVILKKIN